MAKTQAMCPCQTSGNRIEQNGRPGHPNASEPVHKPSVISEPKSHRASACLNDSKACGSYAASSPAPADTCGGRCLHEGSRVVASPPIRPSTYERTQRFEIH